MIIQFHLLDKRSNTFTKVYFEGWNDRAPFFTNDPKKAKQYWQKKQAEEDMELLKWAQSPIAITLSIKLVQ
ncbi:hypothetical protein [uncultured Enterococcus sp.]|uniref:hypothetical protein n=1 Tax=uncultured Enterococcus sp. TaxID=167972 RepID=UPI002AA8E384|nr:hypothetical protein [uncultured Enterococcus sp.]